MPLNLENSPEGWYCWQAQPKREYITAELIRIEADLETYCPRLSYDKKTKRGKVRWVEALFPGYFFVRCQPSLVYRRIMSMGSVTRLVTAGEHPPLVPDAFIADLRHRLGIAQSEADNPVYEPSTSVFIADGPFANFQAVVTGQVPGRERVRVLLEFLGQPIHIELPPNSLLREKPKLN